jgi:hypothetical protein
MPQGPNEVYNYYAYSTTTFDGEFLNRPGFFIEGLGFSEVEI